MLTAPENETLTRTGADTPMGRLFRRYWQPALLSRELPGPDCAPKRLRILGEDFLAFRDSRGVVGIVEPRCPHRGADLYYGRTEDCGLRCVYHGWKFDTRGACVDIPTLAPEIAERVKPKAQLRALQVCEAGDIVWVWFGSDPAPPLPALEFTQVPAGQRYVTKKLQQCNWAQAVEGALDTAHFSYLHAGVAEGERASLLHAQSAAHARDGTNEPLPVASFRWMVGDAMPRFTVLDHDAGLLLCAARTSDSEETYFRCTQFLMPSHSLAPGAWPGGNLLGQTWVPIDDTSCWIYCYCWHPERPLSAAERARFAAGSGIFPAMDADFVPLRRRENEYLLDRDIQRNAHYSGILGISEQDAAIADSQGLIVDRTRELLGPTDLGIVRFRQLLLAAAEHVERGESPRGADAAAAYALRSGDFMLPPGTPLAAGLDARFGDRWGQRGTHLSPARSVPGSA